MNVSPESKSCFSCEWDLKGGLTRCSLCGTTLVPGQKEAEFAAGMYFGLRQLAESQQMDFLLEASEGRLYSNHARGVHGAVDLFISANWVALGYGGSISRYVPTWRTRASLRTLNVSTEIPLLPSLEQVTKTWRSELDRWDKLSGVEVFSDTSAERCKLWHDLPLYLASLDEAGQTITVRKFTPGDWIGHVRPESICCLPGVGLKR